MTSVRCVGEAPAPRREVGEDEDPLAGREHRLDDLLEPGQLAGATGERSAVVAVGRRVVADLLERRDRGEDRALLRLGSPLGMPLTCGDEVVEHGLVQTDLLGRHRAVVELVDLVRQLGSDLGLALRAAEQQDPVQRAQRGLPRRRPTSAR